MRDKFLDECESEEQAFELAPWASAVRKVEGGYHAFERLDEACMWDNVS